MTDIQTLHTDDAPAAIGPYSQATAHGGLIFCSGQVAIDPATQELVEGDVQVQARRCLQNLQAVLGAAGSGLERALRLTVFLTRMEDFGRVNEVYAEFFPGQAPPARAAIEVSALPKGALVEIDCIAAAGA